VTSRLRTKSVESGAYIPTSQDWGSINGKDARG